MNYCCLCLTESHNCLNIFNNSNSSCYNDLSCLIKKYFWFVPEKNAFRSNFICAECWETVKNFHKLYIKVEEAHKRIYNIVKKDDIDNIFENENTKSFDYIKEELIEPELHIVDVSMNDALRENNDSIDEENSSNSESFSDVEFLNYSTKINSDTTDHMRDNLDKIKIVQEKSPPKRKSKVLSERAQQSHEYDKKVSSFLTLKCDLCSEVLATFGKLKTHFQKVHNLNGYAVCCKRKYYKRNLLIDHIDTHLNPDHFKCPTCNKTFTNKESHKIHIKTLHLPERVLYECGECPKKFCWRYALVAHQKTHAPKEEWKYKCEDCDKTFANHTFLSSHKHYVHKETKKICDLCGKLISSKSFRKHQMKHTGIVQPKIQCQICGSWLNKKYIKIHLKNHEESGVDHICVHCGKISPNSKALYKHIYEVHNLKKTLKCNVCDKTFKSKDLLAQHMPVHTGEINFLCEYCPRTFKFKSNWHDHKKKEHLSEFEEERKRRLSKTNLNNDDSTNVSNKLSKEPDQDILRKAVSL